MIATVFKRPNGGRVKISKDVIDKLEKFMQNSVDALEAGGLLLGRRIIDSSDIVIDLVTTPSRFDIRKRCYFYRDSRIHQSIIEMMFKKSSGTCILLGEWHTHPEYYPTPSGYDISEWKRQLKDTEIEDEHLLFLIAGISEIAMWEASRKTGTLIKLERIDGGYDY